MSKYSRVPDDHRIPSELVMDHLQKFFMFQLEGLANGMDTPERVRNDLRGLNSFVQYSCGVHARLALSNEVDKLCRLTDEQMISIAKETFKIIHSHV